MSASLESMHQFSIAEDPQGPLCIDASLGSLVRVEKKVRADLFIDQEDAGAGELRLIVEQDAQVRLFVLSRVREGYSHELKAAFELGDNAELALHDIHLSDGAFGLNANVFLQGCAARFSYGGLHYLRHRAKSSTELVIRHEGAQSSSAQAFRGVYGEDAQGLFLGKVEVGPQARLCSAEQLYKAVLLSENATALVRPQLEINNRHIKATHGASIGMLDQEALFYLCSRGLSLPQARSLLVYSMTHVILEGMGDSALALTLRERIGASIKASMEMSS